MKRRGNGAQLIVLPLLSKIYSLTIYSEITCTLLYKGIEVKVYRTTALMCVCYVIVMLTSSLLSCAVFWTGAPFPHDGSEMLQWRYDGHNIFDILMNSSEEDRLGNSFNSLSGSALYGLSHSSQKDMSILAVLSACFHGKGQIIIASFKLSFH